MRHAIVASLVILALSALAGDSKDVSEKGKIEFLISSVEHLQGAVFIRNGSEHNAKEAADHLRMKLAFAGRRVQSAEDFIRLCASKSSVTGQPYLIRFPDGTTQPTEVYLRQKLKEYDSLAKEGGWKP